MKKKEEYYMTKEWQRFRALVFKERGKACELCGSTDRVTVHHLKPVKERPDLMFDMNNVQCLCLSHHNAAHDRNNNTVRTVKATPDTGTDGFSVGSEWADDTTTSADIRVSVESDEEQEDDREYYC